MVAPAAFGVLRSFGLPNANEIAGSIVTRSLSVVNIAGFVIALILLVTLILRRNYSSRVSFIVECICLGVIALTTGVGPLVHRSTNARIARGDGRADRSDRR